MGTTNNVIDLSKLEKKKFQVGDKTLELDVADLKVVTRFNEVYPKILEESDKVADISEVLDADDPDMQSVVTAFNAADQVIREAIDFIFDSNVCEICMDHGSVFDPIDGQYRFEHIIDALLPLYEDNLAKETKKIQNKVKTHTSKYTKKK